MAAWLVIGGFSPARATLITTWLGTDSTDWNDANNWSFGLPATNTGVFIDLGSGNQTIISNANAFSTFITVGADSDSSASTLLTLQGGQTLTSTGAGTIGDQSGSTGAVTVTDTNSLWSLSNGLTVGNSGNGTLTIANSGAIISNSTVTLGYASGSNGTSLVTGTNSTLSIYGNTLTVGLDGDGNLTIANGGVVNNNDQDGSGIGAYIGMDYGSNGLVTVTGANSTWNINPGALDVGVSGNGTLTISNGGNVSATGMDNNSNGMYIGDLSGAIGTTLVTDTNSTLNITTGGFIVGNLGVGNLTIQNGGAVNSLDATIASGIGSMGTVTVSDNGSVWNVAGDLQVGGGGNGTGTLTIQNGGNVTVTGTTYVGYAGTGTGNATVTGSGSVLNTATLLVGLDSSNTLTIANGGNVTDATAHIGILDLGNVIVTGANSTWDNTNSLVLGTPAPGYIDIENGGVVSMDNASGSIQVHFGGITVNGTNSALNSAGSLVLGTFHYGTLTVSHGGNVSVNTQGSLGFGLIESAGGDASGNSINVTDVNSTLNVLAGAMSIADDGGSTADLTIANGGVVNISSDDVHGVGLYLGRGPGSTATVEVHDAGSILNVTGGSTVIGGNNTIFAGLTISNGGVVNSTGYDSTGNIAVTVGENTNPAFTANVTVTDPNSTWNIGNGHGALSLGDNGTGILTIANGGIVNSLGTDQLNKVAAYLGNQTGSSGNMTVTGAGSLWSISVGSLIVGNLGVGNLNIQNGGNVTTTGYDVNQIAVIIGAAAGGTGNITVTDPGSVFNINNGGMMVDGGGNGALHIANGGVVNSGSTDAVEVAAYIGFVGNSSVSVDGSGSQWNINNGYMILGYAGNGTLNITNGGVVNSLGSKSSDGSAAVIGYEAGQTGTALVDGANSTWNLDNHFFIVGNSGNGNLTISNGGNVSAGIISIAQGSGSNGSISLDGANSTMNVSNDLYVGNNGNGSFTIGNGANFATTNNLFIGNNVGSNGTVTVDGANSTLSVTGFDFYVGNNGNGTLAISNGGNVSSYRLTIGNNGGSNGSVTVDGANSTLSFSNVLVVGNENGNGSLAVTNGGTVSAGSGAAIYIGTNGVGIGTVTVDGANSTMTNFDSLAVGASGNGILNVTNGGNVSSADPDNTYIGAGGTTGIVNVDGANSTLDIGYSQLVLGYLTLGTLNITNGGAVRAGDIQFGNFAGYPSANGTATVDGANSTLLSRLGQFDIGFNQSGSLTISNGGNVSGTDIRIGENSGSNGTVTVGGANSTLDAFSILMVGDSGNGTLTILSGGTVVSREGLFIGQNAGSTGIIDVNAGGVLQVSGFIHPGGGNRTLNMNGGTLKVADYDLNVYADIALGDNTYNQFDTNGSNATVFSVISGALGNVQKEGNGTLILTNAETYGGITDVFNGTLQVDAGGSINSGNDMYIGSPTMGALVVTNGGTVSVGEFTTSQEAASNDTVLVTGSGSTLTASELMTIGYDGHTVMTVDNSGVVNANGSAGGVAVYVAQNADANASLTVTNGSALYLSSGSMIVGYQGNGTLTIANGGLVQIPSLGGLTLASQAGSNGTINLNGGYLQLNTLAAGAGNYSFNFGGGTLQLIQANSGFSTSINATLVDSTTSTIDAGLFNVTWNGILSGTGNLDIIDSGSNITLNAANTFTGITSINSGNLILGNVNALQDGTLNYVVGSGNVDFGNFSNLSLGGLSGNRDFDLSNDSHTVMNLTLGGGNQSAEFGGNLTDTYANNGNLTKIGSGTQGFNGTNNVINGTVTVSNGVLGITGGNFTFNGLLVVADGASDATVHQSGGNVSILTANSHLGDGTGTGTYQLDGGNLSLPHDFQVGSSDAGAGTGVFTQTGGNVTSGGFFSLARLGVDDTGTVNISGGNFSQTAAAFIVGEQGNGTLNVSGTGYLNTGSTVLSLALDSGSTGVINLLGNSTSRGVINTPQILAGGGAGVLIIDGGILRANADSADFLSNFQSSHVAFGLGGGFIDDVGHNITINTGIVGFGGLTKQGTGTLTLATANGFAGPTNITAGVLVVGNADSLGNSVLNYLNSGGSVSLAFVNPGFLHLGGLSGDRDFDLSDNTGTLSAVNLFVGGDGASFTYSGSITDINGLGGNVTKIGGGTWTVSGASTYTGGTMIETGLINFNSASNFGSGNITLSNGGLQWATGTSTDISSQLNGPNGGLDSQYDTLDTNGNDVTLASVLSGSGALVKAGAGNLTLALNEQYTGGTLVVGGEIVFNDLTNFGTNSTVTLEGGGLQWAPGLTTDISTNIVFGAGSDTIDTNDNNLTFATDLSGEGTLVKNGFGNLTLTGTNTYSGGTSVLFGNLIVDGGSISHPNGDLYVGGISAGLIIQNGGNVDVGEASFSNFSNDFDQITITGAGSQLNVEEYLTVGNVSYANVSIANGGVVNVNGADGNGVGAYFGNQENGNGEATITGAGSQFNISSGAVVVGNLGFGSLNVINGGVVNASGSDSQSRGIVLGYQNSGQGRVEVSDANSILNVTSGVLVVGESGVGALTIANGGVVNAAGVDGSEAGVFVGNQTNSTGAVTVTGPGSTLHISGGALYLGNQGTGSLTIANGGTVTSNAGDEYASVYIGNNNGSFGTAVVTGVEFESGQRSTWTISSDALSVGASGSGTLMITDGGHVNVTSVNENSIGMYVGDNSGSIGNVTVSGYNYDTGHKSQLDLASGSLVVGNLGTGNLTINHQGVVNASAGVYVGNGSTAAGNVFVKNQGLLNTTALVLGNNSGQGSLTVLSGGNVSVTSANDAGEGVSLGLNSGAGYVEVTDAGSSLNITGGALAVGDTGYGSLSIANGGIVNVSGNDSNKVSTYFGNQANTEGDVTVDGAGSVLNTGYNGEVAGPGGLVIGNLGTGYLTISNGGTVNSNDFDINGITAYLGYGSGSQGYVQVTGAGSIWNIGAGGALPTQLEIGYDGTGGLTIANGGYVSSGETVLGQNNDGIGTVQVTDPNSIWDINGAALYAGIDGAANLTIQNGGTVNNNGADGNGVATYIGFNNDSVSSVTVTDPGSIWNISGGALYAGYDGTGNLTIANGGTVNSSSANPFGNAVILGFNNDGSSTVTVTDPGSSWNITGGAMVVGYVGTANLSIANGGVVNSSANNGFGYVAYIALDDGSIGGVTVDGSGSQWNISNGSVSIGDGGTGTLNIQNGGTVTFGSGSTLLLANQTGTATVNLYDGGLLQIGGSNAIQAGSGSYTFNFGGGTLQIVNADFSTSINGMFSNDATSTIDTNGRNALWSGNLGGAGQLVKVGAGNLTLTGTNTYTDGTSVYGGALILDGGSISHPGSDLYVGGPTDTGASLIIQNGGNMDVGEATVADFLGANDTVTVTGSNSQLNVEEYFTLANNSNATLTIADGGTVNVNGADDGNVGLYAGFNSSTNGTILVTDSGSSLNINNGALVVGNQGLGNLTIINGASASVYGVDSNQVAVNIGSQAGANGTVLISGTNSALYVNAGATVVGNQGNGTLTIANGGYVGLESFDAYDNALYIGNQPGANGTVLVTDPGSFLSIHYGAVQVGNFSNGSLTIQNGGVMTMYGDDNDNGSMYIGSDGGANGTVLVTGPGSQLEHERRQS